MRHLKKFNEGVHPPYEYISNEEAFSLLGWSATRRGFGDRYTQLNIHELERICKLNNLSYNIRNHYFFKVNTEEMPGKFDCIFIHGEIEDEWYVVETYESIEDNATFYRCDQWYGLLEFLRNECGMKVKVGL